MSEEKEFNTLVFKAKLAEQTERYEEIVELMEAVVKLKHQKKIAVSTEERDLLSVGYKNVVGSRRNAWRIITSIEKKEITNVKDNWKLKLTKEYQEKLEKELDEICGRILEVVDQNCLSGDLEEMHSTENRVFYYKMKGDYLRYMAEYKTGGARKSAADKASEAYAEAYKVAKKEDAGTKNSLPPTHPILLGLALNSSVFHYEITQNTVEACKIAKKAFEDGIADLDNLGEDSYKDSTLFLGLLRDNHTLWKADIQDGGGQAEDGQGDQ